MVAVNLPERHRDMGKGIGRKGSVGKPLPGVSVRIVEPNTGQILDNGQEGVLMVRGPNVMRGYLNEPEKTAAVLKDGWYDTGDVARVDEDGYIHITGRLSRFSKIGGEMVPHIALEDEIHHVLGSKETLVAVTSVADEMRGERVIVLHVPLSMTVQEIITGLRERGIPNLWIPKAGDFRQVERIPVLGSGKLDLRRMRELAEM